jgi:hypothetical protein
MTQADGDNSPDDPSFPLTPQQDREVELYQAIKAWREMCTGEASVSTIAWPADCQNRRQTAAAGGRTISRELDPIDVLADLLGEEGFEIADTRLAAVVIVQRLREAPP